ncbi:hypothetical protein CYMTET_41024, partial [Cymbomonas tetramitiformis]
MLADKAVWADFVDASTDLAAMKRFVDTRPEGTEAHHILLKTLMLEAYITSPAENAPTDERRKFNTELLFSFLGYVKKGEMKASPDEVRTYRGLYESDATEEWQIVPICDFVHVFRLFGHFSKDDTSNIAQLRFHLNIGRRVLNLICSVDLADVSASHLKTLIKKDRFVLRYLLSDAARLSAAINCAHWLKVEGVALVPREQMASFSQLKSAINEYDGHSYDEIYFSTILRIREKLKPVAEQPVVMEGYKRELVSVQAGMVEHPGLRLWETHASATEPQTELGDDIPLGPIDVDLTGEEVENAFDVKEVTDELQKNLEKSFKTILSRSVDVAKPDATTHIEEQDSGEMDAEDGPEKEEELDENDMQNIFNNMWGVE